MVTGFQMEELMLDLKVLEINSDVFGFFMAF